MNPMLKQGLKNKPIDELRDRRSHAHHALIHLKKQPRRSKWIEDEMMFQRGVISDIDTILKEKGLK